MRLSAWFHLWADGAWEAPTAEWLSALQQSGFRGVPQVGLVGSRANRQRALEGLGRVKVVAEADEGFEQVTLRALHAHAKANNGAVMYAHTKGSWDTSEHRAKWRCSMMLRVVDNWRANLRAMEEYDALGCHWLTSDVYPNVVQTPFFGGNFWMARCDYLRTLPEPTEGDRMDAERWIGLGEPRVLDVYPGWPYEQLFDRDALYPPAA